MSSIDAAIIKALVEHIGSNPDGVIGGGSSASTLKYHFEPLPNSDYNRDRVVIESGSKFYLRIPLDELVPGHTVLRLKRNDSQGTIDTWLCTDVISEIKTRYTVVFTLIEDVETMKLSATEIIKLTYQGNSEMDNSTDAPIPQTMGEHLAFHTVTYVESVNWTDEDEVGPYLIAVDDEHGLSAISHRINYSMYKLLISLIEKPQVIEYV